MSDLLVRGERVVLPDGLRPASVVVRDGIIAAVRPHGEFLAGVPTIDAGEMVLLPGFVDTHVHINDPGRADWEGFEHATRAAAAAGVTMVVDMPLNSIPATTRMNALAAKASAAAGRCFVDVGFWGGVVPGNDSELSPLVKAGVLGFKCFLSPSGVDEFPHVAEADLRRALPILADLGVPLLVHAELPELLRDVPPDPADATRYATWLASRPSSSEVGAIELLIRLADEFRVWIHVVHLATADALPSLATARRNGARITVETCPHYLTFAAEEVPVGATAFKCAPPIRDREHRERLWHALDTGEIDLVASDHSPAPAALKHANDGDFMAAWGGIASLQVAPLAVWSGALVRGLPVERLATWLSAAPARLAGVQQSRGAIAPGRLANLVIFDPEASNVVDPPRLQHRHPVTPYAGMTLRGAVKTTILHGSVIVQDGSVGQRPLGRIVYNSRRS